MESDAQRTHTAKMISGALKAKVACSQTQKRMGSSDRTREMAKKKNAKGRRTKKTTIWKKGKKEETEEAALHEGKGRIRRRSNR